MAEDSNQSSGGIKFKMDTTGFERAKESLDPASYVIAMQAAISRTVTSGKAQAARIIGKKLNLKISDIKKTIAVKRSSFDNLKGSITVTRRGVPLIDFHPTQQKLGVSVKVWKDRPRQLLKHTFIATMKSGHVGVFERRRGGVGTVILGQGGANKFIVGGEGKNLFIDVSKKKDGSALAPASKSGRVERLPLQQRYGPTSVTAIVGNRKHAGSDHDILIDLSDTLEKNIDQQIRRMLNAPQSAARLHGVATKVLGG